MYHKHVEIPLFFERVIPMTKKISVILAIVMLLTCVFAACGDKADSNNSAIVGTWTGEDEGIEVIYCFNADGTGYSEVWGMKVDLTYEIKGDEIVMVVDGTSMIEDMFGMTIDELLAEDYISESDLDGLITTESFSYSLDGDVLTIDGTEYTKAD